MNAPQGKKSRLGYGEFAPPGELSPSTWDARRIFFEKVEDLAPEVLQVLRDDVFPHYRQPADWTIDPSMSGKERYAILSRRFRDLIHGTVEPTAYDWSAQHEAVKANLLSWAARFHIEEDWVLRAATGTLAMWSLEVSENIWAQPPPQPSVVLTDGERRFAFEHLGWQPGILTRDEIRANIRLAFEVRLRQYLDRIEALATERGLEKTPEKRPRWGQDTSRHFEWLVRWQVQGWTQERVAKEAEVRKNTVFAGIKEAAKAIGLTRRSRGSRGKP